MIKADIISSVEFDHTGDYLATGDKGGRVVLFERNDGVNIRICCYYYYYYYIFIIIIIRKRAVNTGFIQSSSRMNPNSTI
jgi:hypothetical protein